MQLTTEQIKKFFSTSESRAALKGIDFLDGKQEPHMESFFNHNVQLWKQRGFQLRYRNIVERIIEKSGMVFKDNPPILLVYKNEDDKLPDENETGKLKSFMEEVQWEDFFTNADIAVRLLKTVLIYVQYDQTNDLFFLELLHHGNCEVIVDPVTHDVDTLVYKFEENDETKYRVIDETTIWDYQSNKDKGTIEFLSSVENPLGFVPACFFHDTRLPRTGVWNNCDRSLVNLNEQLNVHISETEWAARWMRRPTLYTNANILGEQNTASPMQFNDQAWGDKLGRNVVGDSVKKMLGGPDSVLQIESVDNSQPIYLEFKAPVIDLQQLDNIMINLIDVVASDWSVQVNPAQEGQRAAVVSGFALIVKELPNLELKKLRQKRWSEGLEYFFDVIKSVVNVYRPNTFTDNSTLCAEFNSTKLPIDTLQSEQAWDVKIKAGRASIIDYLIEEKGFSEEEAEKKLQQIMNYSRFNPLTLDKTNSIVNLVNSSLITNETAMFNLANILPESSNPDTNLDELDPEEEVEKAQLQIMQNLGLNDE